MEANAESLFKCKSHEAAGFIRRTSEEVSQLHQSQHPGLVTISGVQNEITHGVALDPSPVENQRALAHFMNMLSNV